MTIEGPRLLDKPLGGCDITMGAGGLPATTNGDQWEILENSLTPTYAIRTYYDLSGFNMEDMTVFVQGIDIQEAHPPWGDASCTIIDMVTTEFIDNATCVASFKYASAALTGHLPGFPESVYDMRQVIFGQTRTFKFNSAWADITLQGRSSFGTGAATSAKKLFVTRVVFIENIGPLPNPNSVAHIPACDFVAAVVVTKEEDLPYIMRQKRSHEQANRL
jgi:hypothetical protein